MTKNPELNAHEARLLGVLFEKERGIAVPWDDSLRLLEVRYVLAIVDIIGQDDMQ